MLTADAGLGLITDTTRSGLPPTRFTRMPEIDWSEQIATPWRCPAADGEPGNGWVCYTAGLALDDAGLKDDADALWLHGHDRLCRRRRTGHQPLIR